MLSSTEFLTWMVRLLDEPPDEDDEEVDEVDDDMEEQFSCSS